MNIAFWSSESGKCATSGNMLAIGTMASILYSLKTAFVQYDYFSKPIEEVFEGKKNSNLISDEVSYYQRGGIDDLLNMNKLHKADEDKIISCIKNVKNTRMFYIPSSKKVRNGLDDSSCDFLAHTIPESLDKTVDISFVDNLNGMKRLSKKNMDSADVIVVNICQGINDISYILENEALRRKTVFVVGKYDEDSNINLESIVQKYGLENDLVGVVPYNIHFHDAISEGRVVEFISKSMYSRRNDVNFQFINQLYKTTNLVLRKAGYYEVP